MIKKVFLIIVLSISLVFYGCSSMKHSTVVLYVSHKVEGPLYMPEPEPPVETLNPKIERAKQVKETNESKEPVIERKVTQESQTNQISKPIQANQEKKPTRESQPATKKNQEVRDNQVRTNTYNNYQTRTLPRGEFLILEKPIRFAFEKYGIGSYYDDTVQYVADFMKQNTNFQLVVEGHTDRVGEYGFNRNLSLRRSRSAISKLVRAGVDRDRLIESGVSYRFSEYNFNRLNRRVEFIIIRSPEELTNYREEVK